ncbi:MAG: signal peptidase I [Lachnospiraceae bacterium]|nr:signal peptidase I [Lachnospiraceae bacterium]
MTSWRRGCSSQVAKGGVMARYDDALTNQLPTNQEASKFRTGDDWQQDVQAEQSGPGNQKYLSERNQPVRKAQQVEDRQSKKDTFRKSSRAGNPGKSARATKSAKLSKNVEPLTAAQIIRKRRIGVEVRKGYISLAFRALMIVIVGWLLLTQFLLITQMPDESMFPTLEAGDLVIAYRLQSSYSKSDVVVYEVDGEQKIGRVVAKAGDVVTMSDSGTLLVNGTAQTGEILFSTYARDGITYPFTVPENCVFILCDYRTNGTDSRDYGAISLKNVEGKVITILRRRSI